jgi:GNAT superfamily N-acetyltransferase
MADLEIERPTGAHVSADATIFGQSPIERLEFRYKGLVHRGLFQFLNQELRAKHSFSVEQEYPSLFGEYPGGTSLILKTENQIVCHVGFVIREYQHAHYRLKLGLVGNVVTHRAFRGLGLAARLMKEALQELKRRGAVISVLWSDNQDFYLPLGFSRAGREVDLRFSKDNVPVESTGVVREMDLQHDASPIWRIYQKHTGKLDRSLEEQKALCQIPNTRIYVTESNNTVTSYVAINKGADFEDYIHEWGGDLYELQRNIAYCQKNIFADRPLTLIAPAFCDLGPVQQMAVERWDGVLGLVKVLDRGKLLAAYYDYLKAVNIPFTHDRERERIKIQSFEMSLKSDQEALGVVLGNESLLRHPVLPIFLWGFDSI